MTLRKLFAICTNCNARKYGDYEVYNSESMVES